MATTRVFDKKRKRASGKTQPTANADATGTDVAAFGTAGVATVTDGGKLVDQFGGMELVGEAGMAWDIVTAGDGTLVFTVPTGKYWRLVSAVVRITADATAANRLAVSTTRTTADATIEAIQTGAPYTTANQDKLHFFLYDLATNTKGSNRVQAQGTLTIAEPVTAADNFTVGDYTFTFVTALTGAPNEILIGANEAATKLACNAAFVDQDNYETLHSFSPANYALWGITAIDFATDDMVFTVTEPGLAGSALVFLENTLTHASNVLDGSGTFGGTTEGVDAVLNHSTKSWPKAGSILTPGQDIKFSVGNGQAGDNFEVALTYLEYASNPV